VLEQVFDDAVAETDGRRVVYVLYAVIVLIAGALGAVIGYIIPAQNGAQTAVLGPLQFSISPLSFAVYGMVMIAITLGVLLGVVQYVSRFDDAKVE
jgi:TRAP-type C4-dicarboxylate transport system permease small subunit